MRLDGTVALITGGAGGIGRATAEQLSAAGARVVIGDLREDAGSAAAAAAGGRYTALDVTDPASWDAVIDDLLEVEGRLDVVHLNAGIGLGVDDVTALPDAAYRRIMAVNVDGVVLGARASLRALDVGGALVATASLAGLGPMPEDPVYAATKHAIVGFVRSLAPGLAPRGITANVVCPGFTDTPMVSAASRARLEEAGRPLVTPEEVARAVVAVLEGGGSGEAWFVQAEREPAPYAFRGIPGPRRG